MTATAGSIEPKMNVIYSWSGTGASGNATTTTIATGALDPGSYTVKATVKEGKTGKEGLKPGQTADCSATFTVKAFEPPTISCSANPTTIKPGESATVTSVGMSPQNRPLTYSYSATGGTVTGTGTTAEFSSAGAPTGVVGITCNVSDDKNHSATANTSVTIVAPVIPPAPKTQALCSINFATDIKRPTRVDNEAKACLDQVALDLQQQADAKAVVVGESNAKEKDITAKEQKVALKHKKAKVEIFDAQRAVNAKDYLVTEKGIDASRVSVMTGTTDGQTVEDYLVPAGATFANDVQGATAVDESAVKAEVRKPLPERHPAKKPLRRSKPSGNRRYLIAKSSPPSLIDGGLDGSQNMQFLLQSFEADREAGWPLWFSVSFLVILFLCLGAHGLKRLSEIFFSLCLRRGSLPLAIPVLLFVYCGQCVLAEQSPETEPNAATWTPVGPAGGDARAFASVPRQPSHLYLGSTNSWLYRIPRFRSQLASTCEAG